MANFRILRADHWPDSTQRKTGSDYTLTQFSESYLKSVEPDLRSELRSKSRGVILLISLVRDLQNEFDLASNTGVYLFCSHGPSHPNTQEVALRAPREERLALIEKSLPPKDFFISNPAMKPAHISIEFQLHGPWMAFLSAQSGLAQAFYYARNDLEDGVVDGALVGGIFTLEEPEEFLGETKELAESVVVQYATVPEHVLPAEACAGKYGPLTSIIERLNNNERVNQ